METGLRNHGQIGDLTGYFLFGISNRQRRSINPSHMHHDILSSHSQVLWFEQQRVVSRKQRDLQSIDRTDSVAVNDPMYKLQWYLHKGGLNGFDMNVEAAWRRGFTGKQVVVSILDDGIERDHPDLFSNYDPYASYDMNEKDNDPMPRYNPSNENRHGTRCAGEVSAVANNSLCVVGVAFDSKIGGVRMLDGDVYDAVEAASLSFNRSHIDIYSASWGPDDNGRVVDGPGVLAKKAFLDGINHGRGGKGSIFVWASGNGGSSHDSCNCDGYANSIYTLSISSTSERGTKPWYLEECSSTIASTYSSGANGEKQIVTTDLRKRCTYFHTGTSASAPLAAGIVALILEANPDLTWRDVQYITLMASRPEPMVDGQWVTNALNRKVSLRYGYGLMDASRMVDLALVWRNVPEKDICTELAKEYNHQLYRHRHISTIVADGCSSTTNFVKYLEHVQCVISLQFHSRGNLVLSLTSPMGTRSTILPGRSNDASSSGFDNWPFLSVHFWGEDPRGEWKLEIGVDDPRHMKLDGGKLVSWSLILHGTVEQPVRLRNETPLVNISTDHTPAPDQNCHAECEGGCHGPSPADCVACRHLVVTADRTCVLSCVNGTYRVGGQCIQCAEVCLTCFGPSTVHCLTCPVGLTFLLQQNTCLRHCPVSAFPGGKLCLPCAADCHACFGPESHQCTSCRPDWQLTDGTCTTSWYKTIHNYIPGLALRVSLLCFLLLVMTGFVVVAITRRQRLLCCFSSPYDKLPCQDTGKDDGEGEQMDMDTGGDGGLTRSGCVDCTDDREQNTLVFSFV